MRQVIAGVAVSVFVVLAGGCFFAVSGARGWYAVWMATLGVSLLATAILVGIFTEPRD
jgi:hypothetical protein